MNSPDRFDDVVYVAAVGQEQSLKQPDGRLTDLLVAFEFLEAVAIGFQPLGGEQTLEAARVDRLVEQAVVILFALAAARRDAFGAEGPDETVARQAVELICVVSERVE
ncbi:MAG: hypothetical protein HQ592_09345, partial [Planctomycetes bacterium]|nr:hypothetical protein [Planctomycetota bacterium]